MTAQGIAARMIAKYGAEKALERALEMSWSTRFTYRFSGVRETAYYVMRWTFWDTVALIAQRRISA